MYVSCKYASALKCNECTVTYHKQCKKFMVARAKDIASEITPFQFSNKVKIEGKVMWSRDANKAKSVALKYALSLNTKIRRLSLSQVISLALSNEFPDERVVYIEHTTKLQGDNEKVKGVLNSFIETLLLNGCLISIYVTPAIAFNLEYNKV